MRKLLPTILSLLTCFGLLANSNTSFAICWDDCESQNELYAEVIPPPNEYYFGLGYIQNWVRPHGLWRRMFLPNQQGTNFYFGGRVMRNVAFEIGYEWTTHKPKDNLVRPGQRILIFPNLTGNDVIVRSKFRFKTGYLDLLYYIPLFYRDYGACNIFIPELVLMAGVSSTKPKMHINIEPNRPDVFLYSPADPHNPNTIISPPLRELVKLQGRTRALIRAGIGVQAFVYYNLGLRIMWRYQNTNTLRVRPRHDAKPSIRKIFNDSQSVSISLYTTFPAF